MTSRLDRLLLLLDTGSSTSVRTTAAKQLAQLAAKSVISDVVEDDNIKASRQQQSVVADPTAWSDLMAVIARILPYLHSKSFETRTAASVALSHIFTLVPAWTPVQPEDEEMKPSIKPSTLPTTNTSDIPPFPSFSVQELIQKGTQLLASSGKEFTKPSVILASSAEVKKARKEAMGRLGLDFLEFGGGDDDMDIEKELVADAAETTTTTTTEEAVNNDMDVDHPVKSESAPVPVAPSVTPTESSFASMNIKPESDLSGGQPQIVRRKSSGSGAGTPTAVPSSPPRATENVLAASSAAAPSTSAGATETEGLSARELNRLKRKRKGGNAAFVAAPAPPPPSAAGSGAKFAPTASGNSNKARLISVDDHQSNASSSSRVNSPTPNAPVVIDPSKGGAVAPKASQQSKALNVPIGTWVWDGVVKVLEVDLFSPAWEVRHGAAMALRELLKIQGKCGGMRDGATESENAYGHESWSNDLAAKLLCVFVLDRFGDFVSDQVVAPVRETVSQTLASLLLHMPRRSVAHVHSILLQMIRQDFLPAGGTPQAVAAPTATATITAAGAQKGKDGAAPGGRRRGETHVWEVRHAGLLGIKYEVAVRSDLFESLKGEGEEGGTQMLQDVVDAAMLGLGDPDDDVRSVAASCLLPVASHLVEHLPESLERVLSILWSCLGDMKDDLSSSVGAVMDLLGKLVAYDKVISLFVSDTAALPLTVLAPTLFPFFRHTIPNVRFAVVDTLHSFMAVPTLPRDWITTPFLRLLFQNLVVEEREDIREATLSAWRSAISILCGTQGLLDTAVDQALVFEWFAVMMTPLGMAIDASTFYHAHVIDHQAKSVSGGGAGVGHERHNVDKNMLTQDLSLITTELTLRARVAAATAIAYAIAHWPQGSISRDDMFRPVLGHYIDSTSMLQKFLAAIIAEEWGCEYDKSLNNTADGAAGLKLIEVSSLAKELSDKTLAWLQASPPVAYHEMAFSLARLHADCHSLLQAFIVDCKVNPLAVPSLGAEIDITGANPQCFTISTAQATVGQTFNKLKDTMGRSKKKELAVVTEKRSQIVASIERYNEMKAQHDVRVSAVFAAAFVAFKSTPDKVSPVVKGIMNGIKMEDNIDIQKRCAVAVASFIQFCAYHHLSQPPEKIVKNLCTFLCQDTEQTPTFAYNNKQLEGILSCQSLVVKVTSARNAKENGKESIKSGEGSKAWLSRRGAGLAFNQLSCRFGAQLLETVPNMWHAMTGGLSSAFKTDSPEDADALMQQQYGQDVIDSLSVLDAVVPTLHEALWPRIVTILPMITLALRSRYAIIRQCAAKCMATICNVMTTDAMHFVIENIVPFLGDALNLPNRQGATELVYHIVRRLDVKALPYVIFMVVPVLGRMSDPDDDVRSVATNTFASLVKMVPLEVGLPDPPGFSEEMLKRRESERQFLAQLLDGSKVEQYIIPTKINAELRKYQQDGVNWLAFLAKYQLHGILCDDMGLGKTLQSICILASKHFERRQRHEEKKSPDSVLLPSLIVCPPTLTGHWYYEILKYADNLRPIMYTGSSRDRAKILSTLSSYDVVITSYEVVRNDIANLEGMNWLYCILDEGHVIKNAKTKLTKAVKSIRAQHRLILSGTPIQNNVLELWSLFDFLMPGFLGTESTFNERFSKPILSNRDGKAKNGEAAALALEALHKQVLPFLLRRLKEDVLNDLPPKIIQDYYCELSDVQKHLYDDFNKSDAKAAAEDDINTSAKSEKDSTEQRHVFQSLQYLRKLCNHPALVLKNDDAATKTALSKVGAKSDLTDIQHAPKLLALKQLLTDCGIGLGSHNETAGVGNGKSELADESTDSGGAFSQHRVLIFCQMKQMLDIIETDLFKVHMPSVTYMRLDGTTDANKRHAIVQTFNGDPSIDCLLLTTHVGGLGLTLTGADTVIFVEHDWNPMKDLQAMDRAHRIGQKKVVNVYRLITKGTLEEKIMGLQRFKLNIANSVVTQQNAGLASMDTDLVLDLFKHTTDEEEAAAAAKKKAAKENAGPMSQKNLLAGLEDLPTEDEYESLNLNSFMGSLRR